MHNFYYIKRHFILLSISFYPAQLYVI